MCGLAYPAMSQKMLRAVVRGIDIPPKRTDWAPEGTIQLQEMLIAILPPPGQDFVVVWQTLEENAAAK